MRRTTWSLAIQPTSSIALAGSGKGAHIEATPELKMVIKFISHSMHTHDRLSWEPGRFRSNVHLSDRSCDDASKPRAIIPLQDLSKYRSILQILSLGIFEDALKAH
jgi:hypothetical protein